MLATHKVTARPGCVAQGFVTAVDLAREFTA